MATKLGLYNGSAMLVGEEILATLTDDNKLRRTLDQVYLKTVNKALSDGYWTFATRAIQASSVPSIVPTFGYQFAFTKPDDWLRTAGIWRDPLEQDPLTEYAIEQGYFYASIDPIFIRYVSNDDQYGMDLGKWPPLFESLVEAELAAAIAPTIRDSKLEDMIGLAKMRLSIASNRDVMEKPPRFAPVGGWVRSRWGNRGSSLRGTGRGL